MLHDEFAELAAVFEVVVVLEDLVEKTFVEVVSETGCAVKIADNTDAMSDVEMLGIGTIPG